MNYRVSKVSGGRVSTFGYFNDADAVLRSVNVSPSRAEDIRGAFAKADTAGEPVRVDIVNEPDMVGPRVQLEIEPWR